MKFTALDYRDRSTPLCEIAKLHDTDKCSIRKPGSRGEMDPGHSHPYSIFYHDFLNTRALENLNVAEIGHLEWREFENVERLSAQFYGLGVRQLSKIFEPC